MKKTLLVLLAAVVIGTLAWILIGRTEASRPVTPPMTPDDRMPGPTALDSPGDATEVIASDREEPERAPVEARSDEPSAPALQMSRVFGRIVGVEGDAIGALELTLGTYRSPWAEGVEVPVLEESALEEKRRWKRVGYRTATDADGKFAFDVATPEAIVSLSFDARPFLDKMHLEFGGTDSRNQAPLRPGDNDLGSLVIADAGTISGMVLDPDGAPIAEAQVRIKDFPGGFGRGTRSLADGTYTIDHIPDGTYAIEVIANGFLLADASGLEVEARRDTGDVELRPARAPSVSGSVHDQDGAPLAGVRIWGWPASSGRGAGASSKEDGRFEVFLAQDEPHVFEAHFAGYQSWGGFGSGQSFPPGAKDMEVVLIKIAETTFAIVDGATGAPIERYGLSIGLQYSPKIEEHENGRTTRSAEPGGAGFCVLAPGYAPVSAAIEYDDPAGSVQTVRLHRGGSVAGKVTSAGEPSAFPTLRIERGYHKTDPASPELSEEDRIFSDAYGYDLAHFEGRERVMTGAEDGSFRIDDLATGAYVLRVEPAQGPAFESELIRVLAGEVTKVEELKVPLAATLSGTIVVASGLSPAGLRVELDGPVDKVAIADAKGSFEFTDLAAGAYELTVEEKSGVVARGDRLPIELAAGETRTLRLDLEGLSPCRITASVTFDGAPAPGVRLEAHWSDGSRRTNLGETDSKGVLGAECRGLGMCRIVLVSSAGFPLGESADLVQLAPNSKVTHWSDLRPGTLELILPESPDFSGGSAHLELTDEAGVETSTHAFFQNGAPVHLSFEWVDERLDLGVIAPGIYDISLGMGQTAWSGRAEVRASEPTSCALTAE